MVWMPIKKAPPGGWGLQAALSGSAEADLRQNALTGQQLCAETDDETHHGQTAVPGFSEIDEAEACVVGHGKKSDVQNVTKNGVLLQVFAATKSCAYRFMP